MAKVVKSTRLNPHCLSALSFCINFLCLLFVVWQSLQCTTKYLQKPQGTEVSTQKAANFPYPAITICGRFQWNKRFSGFNKTYLENVCGIRWVFLSTKNLTNHNLIWSLTFGSLNGLINDQNYLSFPLKAIPWTNSGMKKMENGPE